jgi:hypothetical protein
VDKDIRERLNAREKENVLHRTSHAWSQFSNHPELGFIDVDFLQAYRDKRTRIIKKRIEDAKDEEITLPQKQLGTNEETILNKEAIKPIQVLIRKHLHWHPFKFPSTMPLLNNGSPLTSRYCWLRQAKETTCAKNIEKDMRGNTFGLTGIGGKNGSYGLELRAWITIVQFKRMPLLRSTGMV